MQILPLQILRQVMVKVQRQRTSILFADSIIAGMPFSVGDAETYISRVAKVRSALAAMYLNRIDVRSGPSGYS